MPPAVQSLDEILAELETAYAPVRGIYEQQQAAIPKRFDVQRQGLEGARVKNFDNIAMQAGRAGKNWTGFTMAEQGDYLADKFLPGMQQTYLAQEDATSAISKSLAELEMEKRLKGSSTRDTQMSRRAEWEQAERDRAYKAEQARIEREFTSRENALSRSAKAAEGAADNSDPTEPFLNSFAQFMKGNKKMVSRQEQDKFVNSLFDRHGIKDKGARQIVWDAINSTFKRSGDPTKDWTWKR